MSQPCLVFQHDTLVLALALVLSILSLVLDHSLAFALSLAVWGENSALTSCSAALPFYFFIFLLPSLLNLWLPL